MNDITIFAYENSNVRTIMAEDGTPLFVASDVARHLDEEGVGTTEVLDNRGVRQRQPLTSQVSTQQSSAPSSQEPKHSDAGSPVKSSPPPSSGHLDYKGEGRNDHPLCQTSFHWNTNENLTYDIQSGHLD